MSTLVTKDASFHCCKTQLIKKPLLYYTWSIEDFLITHNIGEKLTSGKVNNNFMFYMNYFYDKNRVEFSGQLKDKFPTTSSIFYSIFLNTIYGKSCKKRDVKYKLSSYSTNVLLYDEDISFFKTNQYMYLPNNTLTIYFEFYIFTDVTSSINLFNLLNQIDTDSSLSTKMSNSLVTIVTGQKETFQVNKFLLCSKSKVFKAMFDCDLQESRTNQICISDIKYNTLKELLHFLQTDFLSDHKKLEEIDLNILCELFIAANKYEIEDLKLKCELHLITNITTKNVVEYLKIAYLHNGTALKKYAKNFIKLYFEDILNTPNFIALMQEYPELIDQIRNVQISTTSSF